MMKKTITLITTVASLVAVAETEYILHLEDAIRVTNVTEYVISTNGFLVNHQPLNFTNSLQRILPYPTNAIPAAVVENGVNHLTATGIVESSWVTNIGAVAYGDAILATKEDSKNKNREISEFSTMYENEFPTAKAIYDYHKTLGLPLNGNDAFSLEESEDYHTAVKRIIKTLGGSIKEPLMTIGFSITNNPTTVGLGEITLEEGNLVVNWGDGTTDTLSGSSITATHTYSDLGDYYLTISGKVTKVSGQYISSPIRAIVPILYDTSGKELPIFKLRMNVKSTLKEIAYFAFWKTQITEVDIPESVTTIGSDVFAQCSKLGRVEFYGNRIETIGSSAFWQCVNLKYIRIPESCKAIGDNAFEYTAIANFVTPECMMPFQSSTQGKNVFLNCTNLESIGFNLYYPTSYAGGVQMFEKCSKVNRLVLGPSCNYLPSGAFMDCISLTSVQIPSALKSTGTTPFSGCTNITKAVFEEPCGLEVYNGLFNTCRLGDLTIPYKVTSVSVGDMPELTNLTFASESKVKSLAVTGCPKLLNVNIPSSVETLNSFYKESNGFTNLYYIPPSVKTLSNTFMGNTKIERFEVPANVTKLNDTFSNCYNLQTITFPEDSEVTNITSACYYCYNLREVKLPNKLTTLGGYTFNKCYALTNVILNASLKTIGNYEFKECISLKSVIIPASVTYVGNTVFTGCQSLETLYVLPPTPPTAARRPIGTIPETCKIYVPASSVDAYKTADGWSNYASQIYAMEE